MTRKISKQSQIIVDVNSPDSTRMPRHPQEQIERYRGHILSPFNLERGRKSKSKETQDAEYRQSVLDSMSKKNKKDDEYGRNVIASVALASPWAKERADRLQGYFPNFRYDKNLKGQVATKDDAGETYRYSTYNPLSGKTRGSSTMKRNTKTGRMRKNFGFGGNTNDARTGVHPAQLAAQSYVKSPMQLAGSALTRRVNRAAPPFADAMSAIGELGSNIGRTGYGMLRDSSRAYFDNADDYGNLKSFGPVLQAARRAYAQNVPNVKQSASRASTAIGDAYEPVRDFMGGLYDYGTSAGYAMGRGGRRVGGAMYRGLRDTVRPFLGEAEPADVASPSMIKRGKAVSKRSLRKNSPLMPTVTGDFRHPQEKVERARAQQRAFGGSSGTANRSMLKRSLNKRQAGPKPNKYFS